MGGGHHVVLFDNFDILGTFPVEPVLSSVVDP